MDLLEPLGSEVDVVLETSHDHNNGGHLDLYREHIDMPVLKSILWEYEEMLLNDGCTGIAVLNPAVPQEVQFDEHKMLIVYGDPLESFESILRTRDVLHTPGHEVHHRSRTRAFVQRTLRPRVRGTEGRSGDGRFVRVSACKAIFEWYTQSRLVDPRFTCRLADAEVDHGVAELVPLLVFDRSAPACTIRGRYLLGHVERVGDEVVSTMIAALVATDRERA